MTRRADPPFLHGVGVGSDFEQSGVDRDAVNFHRSRGSASIEFLIYEQLPLFLRLRGANALFGQM
jgi:hypothetical protein